MEFDDIDKQSKSALGMNYGKYEFWLFDRSIHFYLDIVQAENGDTDHEISVIDAYLPWIGYTKGTKFVLNTTDKKSSAVMPEVTKLNISDYDNGEMYDLFYELEEVFDEVEYEIYDLMYY